MHFAATQVDVEVTEAPSEGIYVKVMRCFTLLEMNELLKEFNEVAL